MPISKSNELFVLIKSLTKSEKRNFRLYANRNHTGSKMKFTKLFDLLEKAEHYHEEQILKELRGVKATQLPNLKRHLYSQIMSSLRVITVSKRPNIEVRELIDFAYILYEKSHYLQAIKILEKAKKHTIKYHLYHMHLTILEFEKKIESRHITRSGKDKAFSLIKESNYIEKKISDSIQMSNLRIHLHARYLQSGHCQSDEENKELETFFQQALSSIQPKSLGKLEKIYLYQSYVWYNYIRLDFKSCLRYAEKWRSLLESEPSLIERDVDLYLRAFHYILSSCFHLRLRDKLHEVLEQIESYRKNNYKRLNEMSKIISFLYVHTTRLNKIIINGNFQDGQQVITRALRRINRYQESLDSHRILVFYYKIAWIYFGAKNYAKSIFYLNKIINNELPKLRIDLQIYSRLMFLMCHYELDNFDTFKYAIKTFQPYYNKIQNTNPLQEITQETFKHLAERPESEHKSIMKEARSKLIELKKNKYYSVSFTYLEVISWLESKISNKPLPAIIAKK